MRKMMVRLAAGMCAAALLAGAPAQMASANASKSKVLKNYVKFLKDKDEDSTKYRYFALVDANKDGVPELLATSSLKGGKAKNVSFVSYHVKSGEAVSAGGYGTDPYLYYNTKQKGILFATDSYEYLNKLYGSGDKYYSSNVKSIYKKGSKYIISEGHMSGEHGFKNKKVTKSQLNQCRKTWAFTANSANTKKIHFCKVSNANLNKLKAGKIVVQK